MSRSFEEVLFAGYDDGKWWFDRFADVDTMFISDQLIAYTDQFSPEFNTAVCRGIVRTGFLGYII